MNQVVIDFEALARNTDPRTSHRAAARVEAASVAARVLTCLRMFGPQTSHEIADRLGLSLVTVSPRLKPLCELGYVQRSGVKDGRTIWAAVDSRLY